MSRAETFWSGWSRYTWHMAVDGPVVWMIGHIWADPYSYVVLPRPKK